MNGEWPPHHHPRKFRAGRYVRLISLSITMIVVVLVGCGREDSHKTTVDDVYVPVKVQEVNAALVERTLDFSARLAAIQQAAIGPQFSAWVKKLLVDEGDMVKKGQLLVVLDDSQAKQANAQYEAARKEYERTQALRKSGAVTQQQVDQVEAAYEAAKAGYELVGSNTNIRAPFSGVVSNITVEVGEAFNSMAMSPTGKPSLLSVLKVDSMKAEIRVSDSQLDEIKIGQLARVEVDAFPDTSFDGIVINIEPAADPATGTFKVEIAVPNPDGLLRSGLYARVKIVTQLGENVIAVPHDAIIGDTLVFIVKGNKARSSLVKIAFHTETDVVIDSGVSDGDTVIVGGVTGLFDSAEIRIIE